MILIFDILAVFLWGIAGAYTIGGKSRKIKQFQECVTLNGDSEGRQIVIRNEKQERVDYVLMYAVAMIALINNVAYEMMR